MAPDLRSRVLAELRDVEAHGRPFPTTRELAEKLKASLSSVHTACDALRESGVAQNHAGWGLRRPVGATSEPTDLPGSIAGPGGPFDRNAVVVDTSNAIILDYTEVAIAHGAVSGDAISVVLEGRVNQRSERAAVMILTGGDGAAALVDQLLQLASRDAGTTELTTEFLGALRRRMTDWRRP